MCPPNEGDFLPPINSLPPRPSTMPPLPEAVVPPSFAPPVTLPPAPMTIPPPPMTSPGIIGGVSVGDFPPPPDASDNMVMPPEMPVAEPPRRRGRRRAAEAAEIAVSTSASPLPPVGLPLTLAPAPIFGEPSGVQAEYPNPDGSVVTEQATYTPPPPPLTVPAATAPINTHALPDPAPIRSGQLNSNRPTFSVRLGTTVNLGNFENIKYDIGMDNISVDATEEQLRADCGAGTERANFVMDLLGQRLYDRVREVKEARGITD